MGLGMICGIDEAGRGPWAGPVIAAAVILDPKSPILGLADSKTLSHAQRQTLAANINRQALTVGVGSASVAEIDSLNILRATFLAMQRAVAALGQQPGLALVDGNQAPPLPCPVRTIIDGDALEPAIGAASIIAKVARDALMDDLDRQYPDYHWARNKGYGTAAHRAALLRFGVTPHHRTSFKPVSHILCPAKGQTQPILR
ncbi:MAG TPA: ribonuclease HII [Alphaproteobacteria bacterium]|nr:ribonuclease HII [Alphaproteobacteria bacterium]HAJ47247.1 ribonuclease HII [Alphaproteobacteria bacterium]